MSGANPRKGPASVSDRAGWTDQICFYQVCVKIENPIHLLLHILAAGEKTSGFNLSRFSRIRSCSCHCCGQAWLGENDKRLFDSSGSAFTVRFRLFNLNIPYLSDSLTLMCSCCIIHILKLLCSRGQHERFMSIRRIASQIPREGMLHLDKSCSTWIVIFSFYKWCLIKRGWMTV